MAKIRSAMDATDDVALRKHAAVRYAPSTLVLLHVPSFFRRAVGNTACRGQERSLADRANVGGSTWCSPRRIGQALAGSFFIDFMNSARPVAASTTSYIARM